MASSERARAPCRRQAAAAAAARSIETLTLHFGGSEDCRGLMPRRATRGNVPSIKPSRALHSALIGALGYWPNPRCQSHHCLNATCGAAAEGVAQVETGHGEPVGKTHSSERGPRLVRQLGSGHAHAARQRWTAAKMLFMRVSRDQDKICGLAEVWKGFRNVLWAPHPSAGRCPARTRHTNVPAHAPHASRPTARAAAIAVHRRISRRSATPRRARFTRASRAPLVTHAQAL